MIPRLDAEESIRRAEEIAVGTGSITRAREVLERWGRQADADGRPRPASRKKPALFSDEVLARLPVRRVPTRKG
jgi:hypothetical protein